MHNQVCSNPDQGHRHTRGWEHQIRVLYLGLHSLMPYSELYSGVVTSTRSPSSTRGCILYHRGQQGQGVRLRTCLSSYLEHGPATTARQTVIKGLKWIPDSVWARAYPLPHSSVAPGLKCRGTGGPPHPRGLPHVLLQRPVCRPFLYAAQSDGTPQVTRLKWTRMRCRPRRTRQSPARASSGAR